MEHNILVPVKHKKSLQVLRKMFRDNKYITRSFPSTCVTSMCTQGKECSCSLRGQFLICGFVIVVNLVTRFLFFHCHPDPQWSCLERSFRALFQWCLLSESGNSVSLASARMFLVLFLTLESKIFPVYQVNMSDINNLKFKLRFCSYLRRRFQVKTRCDAEIFGSKQRQAN